MGGIVIDSECKTCVDGLFAAGEVLDIDGDCGGYNLQWAWASGYLAGKAAARKIPASPKKNKK